ncbi:MAG: undecaprenyl-diphosphatase [Alphaproteobacteria bacterium]
MLTYFKGQFRSIKKNYSLVVMSEYPYLIAAFLGIVEGVTEFLPVSSTGHLLLLSHFLGFETTGKTFEVLVQLGAILAVLGIYFKKILYLVTHFRTDNEAKRFLVGLLVAFLPAVIIGLLAHKTIKTVFFESPALICFSLLIGGIVLLIVDKLNLKTKYHDAESFPYSMCLVIGLCQCLAMIPGVSRSGATIVGALLSGANKRSAAEFSFFLAMPTMAGAFTLDLYKNFGAITVNDLSYIGVGFLFAFISAIIVVKSLLSYVTRHGFAPFAYWRIFIGGCGLIGLYLL